MVTRQEFGVEFQFMWTDFDRGDEGHVLFLKVTVLITCGQTHRRHLLL